MKMVLFLLLTAAWCCADTTGMLTNIARKKAAGAGSDFPQIEGVATAQQSSATTSHPITYNGSSVNDGDLLIGIFRGNTGSAPSATGWTISNFGLGFYYLKKDASSEGTGETFTTSSSTQSNIIIYEVSGSTGAANVELSLDSSDNATSVTPTWGAADTLWINFFSATRSDWSGETAPTNYGSVVVATNSSSSSVNAKKSVAGHRELNATSDDPGACTYSGSPSDQKCMLVAIQPD